MQHVVTSPCEWHAGCMMQGKIESAQRKSNNPRSKHWCQTQTPKPLASI